MSEMETEPNLTIADVSDYWIKDEGEEDEEEIQMATLNDVVEGLRELKKAIEKQGPSPTASPVGGGWSG